MKTFCSGMALAAMLVALTVFASCSDGGPKESSVTIQLDTWTLAQKYARDALGQEDNTAKTAADETDATETESDSWTAWFRAILQYAYNGRTRSVQKDFSIELRYNETTQKTEPVNIDDMSLIVPDLPLGADVTFSLAIYDAPTREDSDGTPHIDQDNAQLSNPLYKSKAPVTERIKEDTIVLIELAAYKTGTAEVMLVFPDDVSYADYTYEVTATDQTGKSYEGNQTYQYDSDTDSETPTAVSAQVSNIEVGTKITIAVNVYADSDKTTLAYSGKTTLTIESEDTNSATLSLTAATPAEEPADDNNGEDNTDKDNPNNNPTDETGALITIPEAEYTYTRGVTTEAELLAFFVAEAYAQKHTIKLVLNNDFSVRQKLSYIGRGLIIDLNKHTLTIASDASKAALEANSTVYVYNGTIIDGRTADTTENAEGVIFNNKSTLYLKDVTVQGAGHKGLWQDDGSLYIENSTFTGFSAIPLQLDGGFTVISGAKFVQNDGAEYAICNKGALILTGGTTIASERTALHNEGSTAVVGATIESKVVNKATLAILDAYEHIWEGTSDLAVSLGTSKNRIATLVQENGNLVAGNTVEIDTLSFVVDQYAQNRIFLAKERTATSPVITITPTYPLSDNGDVRVFATEADAKSVADEYLKTIVTVPTAETIKTFAVTDGRIERNNSGEYVLAQASAAAD